MTSPDFTTKAGRDTLNQDIDRMVGIHAQGVRLTPEDMEFQSQALLGLFNTNEIGFLLIIAINRLAGHDTNV